MTSHALVSLTIRHILPVASIIISIVCLLRVVDIGRQNEDLRLAVVQLQGFESRRQKAAIDSISARVRHDMRNFDASNNFFSGQTYKDMRRKRK